MQTDIAHNSSSHMYSLIIIIRSLSRSAGSFRSNSGNNFIGIEILNVEKETIDNRYSKITLQSITQSIIT